ncbi:hypothetical protein SMICM17S_05759 [Streptomyces microflavus]
MQASSQVVTVVVLLADPDAPTVVAKRLARTLPARLAEKSGRQRRFAVEVVSRPFTADAEDPSTLMRRIVEDGSAESWDIVVALTDLPLHSHRRRLVVDLSHEHGTALLSLPSLGGWRLQGKARRVVEEAVLSLAASRSPGCEQAAYRRPPLGPFAGRLAPIRPGPVDEEELADLRYVADGPRGYVKLLVGMVRANRPWRLVPGLSKALAAALATGAIATVDDTVWSLATSLGTPRLVVATVGSVGLMIGWLIVDANLWASHTPPEPEARAERPVLRCAGGGLGGPVIHPDSYGLRLLPVLRRQLRRLPARHRAAGCYGSGRMALTLLGGALAMLAYAVFPAWETPRLRDAGGLACRQRPPRGGSAPPLRRTDRGPPCRHAQRPTGEQKSPRRLAGGLRPGTTGTGPPRGLTAQEAKAAQEALEGFDRAATLMESRVPHDDNPSAPEVEALAEALESDTEQAAAAMREHRDPDWARVEKALQTWERAGGRSPALRSEADLQKHALENLATAVSRTPLERDVGSLREDQRVREAVEAQGDGSEPAHRGGRPPVAAGVRPASEVRLVRQMAKMRELHA